MRVRLAAILGLLTGCTVTSDTEANAPAPTLSGTKIFGAPLTLTDLTPLDVVLANPASFTEQPVLVQGMVRKACSKKGCWMELASSMDGPPQGVRVTFQDYGFFVPVDAAGSAARVQGTLSVRDIPKEHVEHLEAEGAHFANKSPDGGSQEVRIVASGVELKSSPLPTVPRLPAGPPADSHFAPGQ